MRSPRGEPAGWLMALVGGVVAAVLTIGIDRTARRRAEEQHRAEMALLEIEIAGLRATIEKSEVRVCAGDAGAHPLGDFPPDFPSSRDWRQGSK